MDNGSHGDWEAEMRIKEVGQRGKGKGAKRLAGRRWSQDHHIVVAMRKIKEKRSKKRLKKKIKQ